MCKFCSLSLKRSATFSLVCPGMLPCNRLFSVPCEGSAWGRMREAMCWGEEMPQLKTDTSC